MPLITAVVDHPSCYSQYDGRLIGSLLQDICLNVTVCICTSHDATSRGDFYLAPTRSVVITQHWIILLYIGIVLPKIKLKANKRKINIQ